MRAFGCWSRATRLLVTAALSVAGQVAWAELITVQVTTGSPLSISCTESLAFGTISVPGNNTAGTVTVAASGGATAQGSANLAVSGTSGAVSCVVVAETTTETVSFSLSGGSGAFVPSTGAMPAQLKKGTDTLDASIQLNAVSGALSSGTVSNVYIGGTLTVPANFTTFGTYQSDPITITVTQ